MTVSLIATPTVRPFRGFADPALPDGYWTCHAALLGDASGGLMSINIRMSSVDRPNVSTLWSIEQTLMDTTVNNAEDIRMDFGLFDQQPSQSSTGSIIKIVSYRLEDLGAFLSGAALPIENIRRPLFLGQARSGLNVDLAYDANNVLNASFGVFVQGYFWGPGAINAPGGPQRPATSLYGV